MQPDEVQLLRNGLRSLRNNFRDHDPQQHTLDTLEQGIVSLMDRLHVLHARRVRGILQNASEPTGTKQPLNSVLLELLTNAQVFLWFSI